MFQSKRPPLPHPFTNHVSYKNAPLPFGNVKLRSFGDQSEYTLIQYKSSYNIHPILPLSLILSYNHFSSLQVSTAFSSLPTPSHSFPAQPLSHPCPAQPPSHTFPAQPLLIPSLLNPFSPLLIPSLLNPFSSLPCSTPFSFSSL